MESCMLRMQAKNHLIYSICQRSKVGLSGLDRRPCTVQAHISSGIASLSLSHTHTLQTHIQTSFIQLSFGSIFKADCILRNLLHTGRQCQIDHTEVSNYVTTPCFDCKNVHLSICNIVCIHIGSEHVQMHGNY